MNILEATSKMNVQLAVNGHMVQRDIPVRMSLGDFLREELRLTGTHLGCEQGACGACTVLIEGKPARSCITLAVQASHSAVTTVEGLSNGEKLHPLQEAFVAHRAFQCGFCTPGMLMTLAPLCQSTDPVTEDDIRDAVGGNVCRCTGYHSIIRAALDVLAASHRGEAS